MNQAFKDSVYKTLSGYEQQIRLLKSDLKNTEVAAKLYKLNFDEVLKENQSLKAENLKLLNQLSRKEIPVKVESTEEIKDIFCLYEGRD